MDQGITQEILHAAKRGDMLAFEQIVFAFEKPVYAFIYNMVRHKEDTADLTQETFIKVFLHLNEYDESRVLSTWIFSIAKYTTYDWLRKKQRRKGVIVAWDHDASPFVPDMQTRNQETEMLAKQLDLDAAMHRIKPQQKQILRLFYWKGFAYNEIAFQLGKPLNTIKTLIRRAKEALRHHLSEESR